jgi:hypothetical protein
MVAFIHFVEKLSGCIKNRQLRLLCLAAPLIAASSIPEVQPTLEHDKDCTSDLYNPSISSDVKLKAIIKSADQLRSKGESELSTLSFGLYYYFEDRPISGLTKLNGSNARNPEYAVDIIYRHREESVFKLNNVNFDTITIIVGDEKFKSIRSKSFGSRVAKCEVRNNSVRRPLGTVYYETFGCKSEVKMRFFIAEETFRKMSDAATHKDSYVVAQFNNDENTYCTPPIDERFIGSLFN